MITDTFRILRINRKNAHFAVIFGQIADYYVKAVKLHKNGCRSERIHKKFEKILETKIIKILSKTASMVVLTVT